MRQLGGHRRSIRLQGYDYSSPGLYFLTLCAQDHQHLFGDLVDGAMRLNPLGEILAEEWGRTTEIRNEMRPDEFVVMPNHMHGLIWIMPVNPPVGAHCCAPLASHHEWDTQGIPPPGDGPRAHSSAPLRRPPRSLGSFVAGYKAATTTRINTWRGTPGRPVWQRGFWEHVVRDERDCQRIRDYIQHNPERWMTDCLRLRP